MGTALLEKPVTLREERRDEVAGSQMGSEYLGLGDSATAAFGLAQNDGGGIPRNTTSANDGNNPTVTLRNERSEAVAGSRKFNKSLPLRDSATYAQNDGSRSRRMTRTANRVLHVLLNLVLVGLVGLAAAVAVVPRVTGSVPLTVLSGSMQPTFRPGDLVVVRPTAAENLHLGDVVTFQPHSGVATLVTHRIVDIVHDADGQVLTIQTQGDANNAPDHLLVPDQIMGRVWYSVPFIGHLTSGRNTLLVISAIGLALVAHSVVLFTKKDDGEAPGFETPQGGSSTDGADNTANDRNNHIVTLREVAGSRKLNLFLPLRDSATNAQNDNTANDGNNNE